MKDQNASILVDFRYIRCESCKVAIHDEMACECEMCGAHFDDIISNHVGLAEKLRSKREAAGVHLSRR